MKPRTCLYFRSIACFAVASAVMLAAPYAWSEPPEVLRFQGTITSLASAPVEDGDYGFYVRVCEDMDCNAVPYDQRVTAYVSGGAYTLVLSPVPPDHQPGELNAAFAEGPRYLEITVETGPSGGINETLQPVQEIASVPFALNASGGAAGFTICTDTEATVQVVTSPDAWVPVNGLSHTVDIPSDGGPYEAWTQVTIPRFLYKAVFAARLRENSEVVALGAAAVPGDDIDHEYAHRGNFVLQSLSDSLSPGTSYQYDVQIACHRAGAAHCKINPVEVIGQNVGNIATYSRMCTQVRPRRQ